MAIPIGSILILDKDNNGFYDPTIDQIQDMKGKVLNADSKAVKETLSDLGVAKLEGIPLEKAGDFMRTLRYTQADAYAGWVDSVQKDLTQLRVDGDAMGAPLSGAREEALLIEAYRRGIENAFDTAKHRVKEGSGYGVAEFVGRAREYVTILEWNYGVHTDFNDAEADGLVKAAAPEQMNRRLAQAEGWADKGFYGEFYYEGKTTTDPVSDVKKELETARKEALDAGIAFDEARAARILKRAYSRGADLLLDRVAGDIADDGDFDVAGAQADLHQAREYAEAGGFDLDLQRQAVYQRFVKLSDLQQDYASDALSYLAYPIRYLTLKKLGDAKEQLRDYVVAEGFLRKAIAEGNPEAFDSFWAKTGEAAAVLIDEQNFDPGFDPNAVSEAYERTLVNGLNARYQQAEKRAEAGDVAGAEDALIEAADFALQHGIEEDVSRAEAVSQKALEMELETAYERAAFLAGHGRKKETLDALKDAEAFAKGLGVPFDRKRAEEIKKTKPFPLIDHLKAVEPPPYNASAGYDSSLPPVFDPRRVNQLRKSYP